MKYVMTVDHEARIAKMIADSPANPGREPFNRIRPQRDFVLVRVQVLANYVHSLNNKPEPVSNDEHHSDRKEHAFHEFLYVSRIIMREQLLTKEKPGPNHAQ